MLKAAVLIFLFLFYTSTLFAMQSDDLKIERYAEQPGRFVFSNKKAAFWLGELQQPNTGGFQGYTILEQKYLNDYSLLQNGEEVDRTTAAKISLFPDRLEREYARFTEIFHFIDSLNIVLIEVQPDSPSGFAVEFNFPPAILKGDWFWDDSLKMLARRFEGYGLEKPVFIGCSAQGNLLSRAPFLSPDSGKIGLKCETGGSFYFAVLFAHTRPELRRMAALIEKPAKLTEIRRRRINHLLNTNFFESADSVLNSAYAWALISLDDLITEQRGKGIWAGLPWFNNYWGRDSFISFSGALLCSGQFKEAREVLLSFSNFQNRQPESPFYGRIPNRVMINEVIYNTADGTPWFVKACEDYVNYSGDLRFREEMFPVLRRAIEGAVRHHTDSLGFLTHGPAETWMDAVGSDGPWSPRGNRAVEVQALWMEQLRISAEWAKQLGFTSQAIEWRELEEKARRNFAGFFTDEKEGLIDHLNTDGSADEQIRPNQVLALTVPRKPLVPERRRRSVIRQVVEKLTYPWGVGSLWQEDQNFHPFHHYEPYYVPDAAYHNGIVWTWLSGPVITALFPYNPDLAYRLMQSEALQILKKDAIGSYSELLEAWPRPGTRSPLISGTVSQAWNLAEFIRNVQQDVLGIYPDAVHNRLILKPRLPESLSPCTFQFQTGTQQISGKLQRTGKELALTLQAVSQTDEIILLEIEAVGETRSITIADHWKMNKPFQLRVLPEDAPGQVWINGKIRTDFTLQQNSVLQDLNFCEPETDLPVAALQGPDY
ncbi:MAG: amylo-alpha-1,6-glucosidase, partial [Calditrichia bacterium]